MESKRLYLFLNILKYDSSENKIVFSKKLKVTKGRFRIIGIRTPALNYDSAQHLRIRNQQSHRNRGYGFKRNSLLIYYCYVKMGYRVWMKPLEYGFEVTTYMYGCGKKFKALVELICSDEFYCGKVRAKTKIVSAYKRFVEGGFMRSEMKHSLPYCNVS